jgi:hypothetical protein
MNDIPAAKVLWPSFGTVNFYDAEFVYNGMAYCLTILA